MQVYKPVFKFPENKALIEAKSLEAILRIQLYIAKTALQISPLARIV